MRILTWNLFHGRAVPPAGRDLARDFAAAIAGWEWDVALLQEVPPWWPAGIARSAGASERHALTSRNAALWLRRPLARRWPDLMKSSGGGANAILVRGGAIAEHRARRLRRWPERRVVHAVRLHSGLWVGNLHAQVHSAARAGADLAAAAAALRDWAAGSPFVLGGDLNVRRPRLDGLFHAGGHGVDHVLASRPVQPATPLEPDRGALSDHVPVLVEVAFAGPSGGKNGP